MSSWRTLSIDASRLTDTRSSRSPGLRQEYLSEAAGIGAATIYRVEKGDGPVVGNVSTVLKIQAAFEQAGIHFIDDKSGRIGVVTKAEALKTDWPVADRANLRCR